MGIKFTQTKRAHEAVAGLEREVVGGCGGKGSVEAGKTYVSTSGAYAGKPDLSLQCHEEAEW